MAEAAFSEDGKYFSSISQDGRLRIWDTETNVLKQEYTPDLHLTSPPSCLQWITVTQSSGSTQKGGRRKSSINEQEFQCIALGTTSGKILIYSVAQAKVETVLEDENSEIHKKNIKCIDWHRNYGLFSCNKENTVLEWDLQSASVKFKYNVNDDSKGKQANAVSAIKLIPHSKKTEARFLVTSSTQVKIWRLLAGDAEVIKCLGHNAAQKALLAVTSLNDTTWLVEGSQTERLLSFWDVTITDENLPQLNGDATPTKKKRKKSTSTPLIVPTPTYNFVLEDAPRLIDCTVKDDEGTKLLLAAATRSGVVHYYGHVLNGASTKPIKPIVSLQISSSDAQPLPLQCCKLSGNDLLVGYTQGPQLMFEKITPDPKTKTQVLIRGETKQSKKKKLKDEASKVRSDGNNDVTYVEPMGGQAVSRKRTTPGGKVEVPMEERLANLTVDINNRNQAAVNHNLTKLLMQGLHSKDKKIIQTVLQNKNYKVAIQTVSNLPVDYIPQLLDELALMASRNTNQCGFVCQWVRACVTSQAGALLGADTHHMKLAQLLAIFTQRRSHLCQLLNLKGRLELTMEQRAPKDDQIETRPVLEYNDSSSEEEMELEHSESEHSEDEWRESSEGE